MKKITSEEFHLIEKRAGGRAGENPLTNELNTLAVGEGMILARKEYTLKSEPSGYANSLRRFGKRFSVRTNTESIAFLRIS
jgi:hypothetical protein